MVHINKEGYLERHSLGGRGVKRDWYWVKAKGHSGYVCLNSVVFQKHLIGKKVKFKVEIINKIEERLKVT